MQDPISHEQSNLPKYVEDFRVFLPSSDGLIEAWASNKKNLQIKYMNLCFNAVGEAVEKIKIGQINSLWELYEFHMKKRHEIAEELDHKDKENIGILREGNSETPLDDEKMNSKNQYKDQYDKLIIMFNKLKTSTIKNRTFVIREDTELGCEVTIQDSYRIISKIILSSGDLTIEHTTIPKGYGSTIFFKSELDKIEEDVSNGTLLFQKNSKIDPTLLYQKIGKIAWYLANLMPTRRGNSAITDMVAKSLLKFHGESLLPFKSGVNWDLVAIFTPNIDSYSENYSGLFAVTSTEKEQFIERYSNLFLDKNPTSPSNNEDKILELEEKKRSNDQKIASDNRDLKIVEDESCCQRCTIF